MPTKVKNQPISDIQLRQLVIEWVPHNQIRPNKYNPNAMTWTERLLLRQSLLEDGWTQPIVTLPDGTIVDGEQRWTTAGLPITPEDIQDVIDKMLKRAEEGAVLSESIMERLYESKRRIEQAHRDKAPGEEVTLASVTGGLVPITRVDFKDEAHQMISTIRHNRARGTHSIDRMSDIAQDLMALGLDIEDMEIRLGMDNEEIDRLLANADLPALLDLPDGPSQAWQPVHIQELAEDEIAAREIQRSQAAAAQAKQREYQLLERQELIEQQVEQAVATAQKSKTNGTALSQIERDKIRRQIEAATPKPVAPAPEEMRRFLFFVTLAEYEKCAQVLGTPQIDGFINLCKAAYETQFGPWQEADGQ